MKEQIKGKARIKINVSRLPNVGYRTPEKFIDPDAAVYRQRALEKAQLKKDMDEIEDGLSEEVMADDADDEAETDEETTSPEE